jgi:mannose-6-phosphate isomerase-like protein (cupin superfamily)
MYVAMKDIEGGMVPKPFERELKIIMSPDMHAAIKGFTFIMSTLAPNGGCTDFHSHESSGELMIFLSGTGKALLGDAEYEIGPGTAMYAPPGVKHKTLNCGNDPLQIACIFVPAISTTYIRENIEAARKAAEK